MECIIKSGILCLLFSLFSLHMLSPGRYGFLFLFLQLSTPLGSSSPAISLSGLESDFPSPSTSSASAATHTNTPLDKPKYIVRSTYTPFPICLHASFKSEWRTKAQWKWANPEFKSAALRLIIWNQNRAIGTSAVVEVHISGDLALMVRSRLQHSNAVLVNDLQRELGFRPPAPRSGVGQALELGQTRLGETHTVLRVCPHQTWGRKNRNGPLLEPRGTSIKFSILLRKICQFSVHFSIISVMFSQEDASTPLSFFFFLSTTWVLLGGSLISFTRPSRDG